MFVARKRGLRVVCQFNVKVHYANENLEPLWTTDSLENWKFDKTKRSLSANKCTVQLKEDGSAYIIKSNVNSESTLDLKISKAAPGFMAGKDGTTYFGTDQNNPWGSMHHAFWPRCDAEGSLITKNGPIALKGKGSFVHALQGMKPHHAGTMADQPRLSERMILTSLGSCAMEFCNTSLRNLLIHAYGIHNTAVIWINNSQRRWPGDRW